ncbi:MAG: non-canonical purine NTP diphosphatase [Bacteroidales bacterium]|nr:non-canonical purine NTP diphosphatase [Bacteroidales bacterium]
MKKIVFATNNRHKIEEVRGLLKKASPVLSEEFEILSLADIGCTEDIPETGSTFAENAFLKAEYVKVHYDMDCFADDSGLEVRALGMEPGVRSARYADVLGRTHDSEANMDKLLQNLQNVRDRQAQFRTVIVLLMDGKKEEFEGICRGEIMQERSGKEGFGYDPIFRPEGHTVTFAEMTMEAKNQISHRGQAVRKLVDYLIQSVK